MLLCTLDQEEEVATRWCCLFLIFSCDLSGGFAVALREKKKERLSHNRIFLLEGLQSGDVLRSRTHYVVTGATPDIFLFDSNAELKRCSLSAAGGLRQFPRVPNNLSSNRSRFFFFVWFLCGLLSLAARPPLPQSFACFQLSCRQIVL